MMKSHFIWTLVSLVVLLDIISVSVAENVPSSSYLRNQNTERREQKWPGIRINCGSVLNWTDPRTKFVWIADTFYSGSSATFAGSNCPTAAVRCKHRFFSDNTGGSYNVPVPVAGVYYVRLHFSEIFYKQINKRVFDVVVQGKPVASKLDVFAVAGRNVRYSIKTSAVVTTDNLTIEISFLKDTENPMISGIEIISVPISSLVKPKPKKAPVKPPTSPPVKPPVSHPIEPPTSPPVESPTFQPFEPPKSPPVNPPTSPPVEPPTSPPVNPPTPPPVNVPAPNSSCKIPKLVGEWESYQEYPIAIAEAQGFLVGDEMVLFSGFANSIFTLTPKVYSLDLKDPINGKWIEQDPIPINIGLTHASHAVDKSTGILYVCGGYIGGHPGPATSICLTYTHKNPPGLKWKLFPSLPGERSGGAMWHDIASGSLIAGAGASRPDPGRPIHTIDHDDVYQIFLDNISAGWKTTSSKFPYFTNHVGRTTVTVPNVGEKHFAVGGQLSEDEFTHNREELYELSVSNKSDFTWTKRQVMPFARGHISESTVTWKDCGIIIIAGAVNATYRPDSRTDDISYYDLATDSWTSIGKFTDAIATPICVIHDKYIYCQSGFVWKSHARRIKIQ